MGKVWTISAVVLFLAAATAPSQVVVGPHGNVGYVPPGGWWGGYGGGYGATTPQESWARGMSDVVRAQGDAYEAAARGAISYEQARASYLENKVRWNQILLERQQQTAQIQAQKQAADRAARERRQASAPQKLPELLSNAQYDRSTGRVFWPEFLATEPFAEPRAKLDQALQAKAHAGNSYGLNQQILDLSNAMMQLLKVRIREVPSSTYMESRKFLDQLIRETRAEMG